MKLFSFFSKFSMSGIVIGLLFLLVGLLTFSGYEAMSEKLGLETKASLQKKLATSNQNLLHVQTVNQNLVSQISEQEVRHKSELKSTREVMAHAIEVGKKLSETKIALAKENLDLKKKISQDQQTAYATYDVPKDLYFIYLKADVNAMSGNNYDSLSDFGKDELHNFETQPTEPSEEKKPPVTKTATDDYEVVILALAQPEEN